MKIIPDLKVEFSDAKAQALARRIAELDDALIWVMKDMAKIATGRVKDPERFAKESMLGLTEILTPR